MTTQHELADQIESLVIGFDGSPLEAVAVLAAIHAKAMWAVCEIYHMAPRDLLAVQEKVVLTEIQRLVDRWAVRH